MFVSRTHRFIDSLPKSLDQGHAKPADPGRKFSGQSSRPLNGDGWRRERFLAVFMCRCRLSPPGQLGAVYLASDAREGVLSYASSYVRALLLPDR